MACGIRWRSFCARRGTTSGPSPMHSAENNRDGSSLREGCGPRPEDARSRKKLRGRAEQTEHKGCQTGCVTVSNLMADGHRAGKNNEHVQAHSWRSREELPGSEASTT